MTSDELTKYELDGRKFASALFDAGFTPQMVEDASVVPCMRIGETPISHRELVGNLFAAEERTAHDIRCITRTMTREASAKSHAFYVGVMSEIEARR